jgi:hypothetical protein
MHMERVCVTTCTLLTVLCSLLSATAAIVDTGQLQYQGSQEEDVVHIVFSNHLVCLRTLPSQPD